MCKWIATIVHQAWTGRTRTEGDSEKAGPARPETHADTHINDQRFCAKGETDTITGKLVQFHTGKQTRDVHGTETCEKKGVDRPLAEGPVLTDARRIDWAEADTSDEESELLNQRRPKRPDTHSPQRGGGADDQNHPERGTRPVR